MPAEHDIQHHDEQLRQLAHDVRHCLHVIGLGAEMLKNVRDNERLFAEICASIDQERRTAWKLIDKLVAAASAGRNNPGVL